jgi:hypothetical protein
MGYKKVNNVSSADMFIFRLSSRGHSFSVHMKLLSYSGHMKLLLSQLTLT